MLTRQDYLSQCTFWCSVLSDVASRYGHRPSRPGSQCTFWCSVLSDHPRSGQSLVVQLVSMHLLVLSAFRRNPMDNKGSIFMSQCTFWCSVLSDMAIRRVWAAGSIVSMHLLVLSAFRPAELDSVNHLSESVSMHLLVLSAFRQAMMGIRGGCI